MCKKYRECEIRNGQDKSCLIPNTAIQQNLFLSLLLTLLRDCSADQVADSSFCSISSFSRVRGRIVRSQRSVHIRASRESTTVPIVKTPKMPSPKAWQGESQFSQLFHVNASSSREASTESENTVFGLIAGFVKQGGKVE